MDDMRDADMDAAADRIAEPLRAPERLSAAFEERLMSQVRGEMISAAEGRRSVQQAGWWLSPRAVSRTPLASVMLAAGFAALVSLSTLGIAKSWRAPAAVASAVRTDTVHVVRFVFVDSTASRIALVGDFNGWTENATPLVARDGTGMWSATVALRPGQHEYAFIVDGKRWVADPFALTTTDEFGTASSRVSVGTAESTSE